MGALDQKLSDALGSAYRLGPELGRGGMAVVFRATDRRLRREVAIKVLPPEMGYSADLHVRFMREAQISAQLSHPNIVQVYDVGEAENLSWFIMALIDGETVRAKVEREGPQPVGLTRRVLQEVAQALAYAHARGVVHRDIKPDNIIIESGGGRAMVTDFGIAKALEDTGVTKPGEIVGTARYMAPEQALGTQDADARADIYSLGLVGHFMLSGTHALSGGTLPAVIAQHVRGTHVDLTTIPRRLPVQLIAALNRCLEPTPDKRYPRAEQFAEALGEIGGELPDTPPAVRRLIRESERFFVSVTVLGFAFGLIGVEHVPPALIVILMGLVVAQWAQALEQSTRAGVTWPAIRRALYAERAGRVQEILDAGPIQVGWTGAAAMAALLIGMILMNTSTGFGGDSWINQLLFFLGSFGGVAAATIFGMRRAKRATRFKDRTKHPSNLFIGTLLALTAAGAALGGLPAFVAVATVGGGGFLLTRFLRKRDKNLDAQIPDDDLGAWQVPRWLDVAGSWLFGRFVRTGWHIRFERAKPAAFGPRLDVVEARRTLKQIKKIASATTGTAVVEANRAVHLAGELAEACESAVRRMKPLASKMARLNDGVMMSKTIGFGSSLDHELDGVEAQMDELHARAQECMQMLGVLRTGLEAMRDSQSTQQLDEAFARAREWSMVG